MNSETTHPDKQEKKDPKETWSRSAKREGKRLDHFLTRLIMTFFNFRASHKDKENEEVAKAFSMLERKWKDACNKKWKSIVPKQSAFADNVERILKAEEARNKEKNKPALKSA